MNNEFMRQRAWHYIDDEGITLYDLSNELDVSINELADFLYKADFRNDDLPEKLSEYVDKKYKERDEMRYIGSKRIARLFDCE